MWGGAASTVNAYRRRNYDLIHESVIMICPLNTEPVFSVPDIAGLSFETKAALDNDLVTKGVVKAYVDGRETGYCCYDYLKAISDHIHKPTGQISIGVDQCYHGKGLGPALLLAAHRELYRLGARQVMLHTVQALFRAISMYKKMGYVDQNIRGFVLEKELEPE